MSQVFLTLGSSLAAIAVAGGAFASHALKGQLSDRSLEIFETATKYQMYHALGIILVALWLSSLPTANPWMVTAGWAFFAGILLFSGSLYALSVTGIKILGAITPLGGVAFLIGWGCLAVSAWMK
ncbi:MULTISPECIES: DUF423 domain-containing protein [Roseofilum]|uniref:DUF423 domain-containing protein n=2 Tax=Roseofilum TaxID=1233426 RepID=A0ABT7B0T4_9CYAN|nr:MULTISPECIES: DUF423 domain-containing protein [Roseofilum]MDJ1171739.1 DUF423 domain-containing protein [Roseofilum acuticapitatum BLCC-M154]MDJ1172749.1 DUF423 domain-containing protein [Roseofilum capinflatum BLCC-M114]